MTQKEEPLIGPDDQGKDILSFVPGTVLLGPSLTESAVASADARRLDVLADAYSLSGYERDELLAAVVTRILAGADGIDRRAASGEPAFVRLAHLGAPESMRAHAGRVAGWTP